MKLLAGVLHAGTIAFDADADGNGVVAKKAEAAGSAAKELLGVPKLMHYLTERLITAGSGSMFTKQLTPAECGRARDALVRTVYARAFDWLVGRINTFVGGKHDADELAKQHYVGLLDIFGFERFAHGEFEQLCINYANEKLQQLFLGACSRRRPRSTAPRACRGLIDFSDNQARRRARRHPPHPLPHPRPPSYTHPSLPLPRPPTAAQGCIDLIEKMPNGVLRLLDAACKTPGGSDGRFCEAVNEAHRGSEFLKPIGKARKRPTEGFVVAHFAGDVLYDLESGSWLERNNDCLPTELSSALEDAALPLLAKLFDTGRASSVGKGRSATFNSIGRRFIGDLTHLIADLTKVESHFIRCIKPNAAQKPRVFEGRAVLEHSAAAASSTPSS